MNAIKEGGFRINAKLVKEELTWYKDEIPVFFFRTCLSELTLAAVGAGYTEICVVWTKKSGI